MMDRSHKIVDTTTNHVCFQQRWEYLSHPTFGGNDLTQFSIGIG